MVLVTELLRNCDGDGDGGGDDADDDDDDDDDPNPIMYAFPDQGLVQIHP